MPPAVPASAEVGLGSDLVSRYVWRGSDLGNAVSEQPWISYSNDVVKIGVWSSWAIDDGASNENDLYVSFDAGPVGITVTDYYLPTASPGDFFNYSDDDGIHIIEVSAAFEVGCASVMGAFNILGDGGNSFWVEASVPLKMLLSKNTEVGLSVGGGNGSYTTDKTPWLPAFQLMCRRMTGLAATS